MNQRTAEMVREQALIFPCEGEELLGVLSSPPADVAPSGVGVVIVVGGPQYRAGSHRQFVLLARDLAAHGHHCIRFDYRGMGDSTGAARDFLRVDADIDAAIIALQSHRPEVKRLVLWGLCDAASAILLYLGNRGVQSGVAAIALLNPWVRSPEGLVRTQIKHYYTQRLREREFWLKLLKGRTGIAALREFLHKLGQTLWSRGAKAVSGDNADRSYQQGMAAALQGFTGPVLLLLSGDDYVAKEFIDHARSADAWDGLLEMPMLERHDMDGMDHTFSRACWRNEAASLTASWIARQIETTA